ncbi:MAG: amino acid deaminase [Lapillicoccus sp.]
MSDPRSHPAQAPGIDTAAVRALETTVVGPTDKGWPPALWGRTVAEVRGAGLTISAFPTPLVTLSRQALDTNLAAMAVWAARHGLALAPHGKTTMAPQLWQEQLEAGAWGITVANLAQLAVARAYGVTRVVLANALISPLGLRWLATDLAAHPEVRVLTWADSTAVVEVMAAALAGGPADGGHPVDVLVELGGVGGRTGARTVGAALEVARAVVAAPGLRLAGVTGYEGALAHAAGAESLAAVRRYLKDLAGLQRRVADAGLYAALPGAVRPLVSAGGSAYPDLVAEVLGPLGTAASTAKGTTGTTGTRGAVTVLLRSGAYLTHDDGFYRDVSPLGRSPRTDGTPLRAALHGWVRVSSTPEPGLLIVDGGKRDLPYDEGLPKVQLVRSRTTGDPATPLTGYTLTALNDQHGFVRFDPGATGCTLAVGDELRLGVSHPCTTFDKWQLIPVVDDADAADPVVIDAVRTFF